MNFEIQQQVFGAFIFKRAVCKCGWESTAYINETQANNDGNMHDLEVHLGRTIQANNETETDA